MQLSKEKAQRGVVVHGVLPTRRDEADRAAQVRGRWHGKCTSEMHLQGACMCGHAQEDACAARATGMHA
eukprot:6209952-Pleurochrysis_carterae.AAC.1